MIDEREGNRKWQDSEDLELKQLFDYDTIKDLGKGVPTPDGYKQIPCHMVYDVNGMDATNLDLLLVDIAPIHP